MLILLRQKRVLNMKLRSKKTGEIVSLEGELLFDNKVMLLKQYNSLAELNEEWEDYEEPKEYWAIDQFGEPINVSGLSRLQLEKLHRLGNNFPSENATMKAIEKLKAWKRLKDKGFKVDLWDYDGGNYQERIRTGRILFRVKDYEENDEYLDLLFGGEK